MSLWLSAQDVRDAAEVDYTTGRYSDASIGSNIQAAQGLIERATTRQFEVQTGTTKVFSSGGTPIVAIPDLASASSISLQGSVLAVDESYWLHPDVRQSGVYVAVQLRQFGGGYMSNPEWWDRNLDSPRAQAYASYGLPNDLSITGTWGWVSKPYDLLHGVKSLALWLTKRTDAMLAGAVQDTTGAVLDYSQWPPEAQAVVKSYQRGQQAVVISG